MAGTSGRSAVRARRRKAIAAFGVRESGTRHPVAAVVMVMPLAALLSVTFGGWHAIVVQASSVAGMLGR